MRYLLLLRSIPRPYWLLAPTLALIAVASYWLPWLNLPGLALVALGTPLVAFLAYSPTAVMCLFRELPTDLRQGVVSPVNDSSMYGYLAHMYWRGDLRLAEAGLEKVRDPLLLEGARMVLDGRPGEEINQRLEWLIEGRCASGQRRARILRTMAGTAPALGLLGTLIGLVTMLGRLEVDGLAGIGSAMSFALMSTVYGVVLANFICKPLAIKLEDRVQAQSVFMRIQTDLVWMLYERQHPELIEQRMRQIFRDYAPVPEANATAAVAWSGA
jgi:chemotaxis protein MotA